MSTENIKGAITNAGAAYAAGYDAATEIERLKQLGVVHYADEGKKGTPFFLKADGTIVPLDAYMPNPVNLKATVKVHETPAFVDYANRFKTPSTVIFADETKLTFTGILDYHAPGEAHWGLHRVTLPLQATDEWAEWSGSNKTKMTQADFASFIEDRIPDIVEPDAADLIELARNFEAKKDVKFSGRIDPHSGSVGVIFSEEVQGVPREGAIDIPRKFTLRLVPFLGAPAYNIDARFRYSVENGRLFMAYELIRPKDVLKQAFTQELETVKLAIANVTILAAPAPGA